MKELSVKELKAWMDQREDFQLIDVREQYEYEICNLGGLLIPMGEVMTQTDAIARDKKVVVHCRMGGRSATIVQMLEAQLGLDNLYNLKGGITAWAKEVDPQMPTY